MKQLVQLFFSRGMSVVCAYVFTLSITTHLPTNDAGVFFMAVNILSLLILFVKFGQDQIIIRRLSSVNHQSNKEQIGFIISSSFFVLFFLSILVYTIWAIFGEYIFVKYLEKNLLYDTSKYVIISVLPVSIIFVISGILKSFDKQGLANFIETGMLPLFMVVVILLCKNDIILYSKAYLLCSIIIVIILISYIKKYFRIHRLEPLVDVSSFRSGYVLMLAAIMNYSLITFPVFVVMYFHTNSDVALLNVSLKLSFIISVVITIFNSLVAPKFVALHSINSIKALKIYYYKMRNGMIITVLFPVIFLFVFSSEVLNLFGVDYVSAIVSLRILLVAQFISVLTGTTGTFLSMVSEEKTFRKNVFISFVFGLPFGVLMIKYYGLNGAALAISFSIVLENILSYFSIRQYFKANSFE